MRDHKYYDDKGNVIATLDASYPFTANSTFKNLLVGSATIEPNIIYSFRETGEVLRIEKEGRIFWRGREVESDDEFRAAMMELRDAMMRGMK